MKFNIPMKILNELKTLIRLVYLSVGKDYFKKNFPSIFTWFADDFDKIENSDK